MTQNAHARVAGKVVAITGASSGIGEATARHLALMGAHVAVGARRTACPILGLAAAAADRTQL